MKKKKKGLTVLELIIVLTISVIVLGVAYTFFFSNSKTLARVTINSDLQSEAEAIQEKLILYGTESKGIIKLNEKILSDDDKYNYIDISDSNGKLEITELKLKVEEEYISFVYDGDNKLLSLKEVKKDGTETTKKLSTNVTEFKVRPLDYRMKPNGNFKEATGLEFSIVLNKKKGYADVTVPVSSIVKFRNKN